MRCLPATQLSLGLTFELPLSELQPPLGLVRTCSTTGSFRHGTLTTVSSSSWIAVKPVAVRSGELTHQMSSRNAINRSDGLSLAWIASSAPCCPKEKSAGIRVSSLLASLALPNLMDPSFFIFPQVRRGTTKLTDEWEHFLSNTTLLPRVVSVSFVCCLFVNHDLSCPTAVDGSRVVLLAGGLCTRSSSKKLGSA